jgi:NAD-dependent SIR2 family protein deacetylase
MRCNHCHTEMQQTDSVTEGQARQTWYRCPLCDASQTISQPCASQLRRVGNTQRCSNGWPDQLSTLRHPY